MKFGEKLKALRLERNLSQKALADLSGITVRTIQNYETTDMLPKRRDTYDMLARALGVDVVELLNEDEEFILNAGEQYGSRGERQARAILDQVGALYAGGDLCHSGGSLGHGSSADGLLSRQAYLSDRCL